MIYAPATITTTSPTFIKDTHEKRIIIKITTTISCHIKWLFLFAAATSATLLHSAVVTVTFMLKGFVPLEGGMERDGREGAYTFVHTLIISDHNLTYFTQSFDILKYDTYNSFFLSIWCINRGFDIFFRIST